MKFPTRVTIVDGVLGVLVVSLAIALWIVATKPSAAAADAPRTSASDHYMTWTTLGTMSGPIPNSKRSQPANLLWNKQNAILVDAGDGAAEQIAKAGRSLSDVTTIVLSHLHVDHTGGLAAIIGMRFQQHLPGTLTIYGPPGTQTMVNGLLAARGPLEALTAAENPGQSSVSAGLAVSVIEVKDGSTMTIGDVGVQAVANSHYGFAAGTAEAETYQSLAFRFTMPDRTIVFTGDTGPSAAVTQLAQGADVLVSEITDPDAELAALKTERADIPASAEPALKKHFEQQHLTADAVGQLATSAGVHSLVLTHNPMPDSSLPGAGATIAGQYAGPVVFANDLGNY